MKSECKDCQDLVGSSRDPFIMCSKHYAEFKEEYEKWARTSDYQADEMFEFLREEKLSEEPDNEEENDKRRNSDPL